LFILNFVLHDIHSRKLNDDDDGSFVINYYHTGGLLSDQRLISIVEVALHLRCQLGTERYWCWTPNVAMVVSGISRQTDDDLA